MMGCINYQAPMPHCRLASANIAQRPLIVGDIEVIPIKMSDLSNISGPSNIDIIKATQSLDIQIPVTPKRMINSTNTSMERKVDFGDLNVTKNIIKIDD